MRTPWECAFDPTPKPITPTIMAMNSQTTQVPSRCLIQLASPSTTITKPETASPTRTSQCSHAVDWGAVITPAGSTAGPSFRKYDLHVCSGVHHQGDTRCSTSRHGAHREQTPRRDTVW